MKQKTLVIVKPDGVQRNHIGHIIGRYEKAGLKVLAVEMRKAGKELLESHYKAHKGKDFFPWLVDFMSSGPVVAIVVEGYDAIAHVRKITGATDPAKAEKGTIRGDLGIDTIELANKENRVVKNLVHASGNPEEAEYEIKLWFPDLR